MTRADLWRAANIMRRDDGTGGINEYIEQISWMFFLKVFEDLEKRFQSRAKLEDKKYQRIIPEKYSWSEWTKKDSKKIISFIDNELFPYLVSLSGTPEKDTISLIFTEIQRNKMQIAANLKDVIDILNQIDFNKERDSHLLSQFYEELLVKLGKESGIAGEFYTPRPIIRLLVKMLDPKLNLKNKNDTKILDPFCGSCGFLIESYKHIMTSGKVGPKEYAILQRRVFNGIEKKALPYLVGLMNCILHGIITPPVFRRNSLNDNILKFGPEDKFDYVMTNPPFGGTENKQIQQNFPVKIQATELLALQQVMRRLKPTGKCGMVVPEGLLKRLDSFAKVRKELIENYNVKAIISLPTGVFANVTALGGGPKTNLLLFDKDGPTEKIWYYELQPPNGKTYSKTNPLKDEDLDDCFKKWKNKTVSENSWYVDVKEIIENDCILTAKKPKKKTLTKYPKPAQIIEELLNLTTDLKSDLKELKEAKELKTNS